MRAVHWLIAAFSFTGLVGCGQGHSAPSPAGPAAVAVSVARPTQKTIRYTVEQPGRIQAFEQTPIYARITGYVRTVNVEIGDRVKRGALLAELDVPDLVEEHARKAALVEQAKIGVLQAEQTERVAEAAIGSAKADLDVTKAAQARATASLERWRSEFERMERLVQDKVIDRQSRDEVRSQFRSAEAAKTEADARIRAAESALAQATARRDKAQADRQAAQSQVVVAQADERQAKAMLDFSRITAPYDGVVADRKVDTGHFLQAASGGAKGDPLFVVVRTDKVRVFVEVPEVEAVQVRQGSPGRIRVHVLNERQFVGTVAGTSWVLDPMQRTLRTEIDFPNRDGLLRPGMYVDAIIDVERPNVWVIPAQAVLVQDGLAFCYQVRDGKTQSLPIRPGLRDGDFIEVLKFQSRPPSPGARREWENATDKEEIIVSRAGELIENQAVTVASPGGQ